MESNEILMIVAIFGGLVQYSIGYLQKKANNPNITFDPTYLRVVIIGIIPSAMVFQFVVVHDLSIFSLLNAFMIGIGGTGTGEKIVNQYELKHNKN